MAPALDSIRKAGGDGLTRLKRSGMGVDALAFSTTPSFLHASLRLDTPVGTAPNEIPPMPNDHDLGVRIHQSVVNEVARLTYGDRALTVGTINHLYDEVTLGILQDGRKESVQKDALKNLEKFFADIAGKPTTVHLAAKDPLTVAFIDQGFTIDIHIASIRQGKTIFSGHRVKAKYEFELSKEAVHLVRKTRVQLVATDKPGPGETQLDTKSETFRLLQEVLFSEVFKDRLKVTLPPMPDTVATLRFQTPRVGARDGWLGVAWNLESHRP